MLYDFAQWLSSTPTDLLVVISLPVLLLDGIRYCLAAVFVFVQDFACGLWDCVCRKAEPACYTYRPSVCVVIAGLNEGRTIGHTLRSLWGTYPSMEIIVVDDGSSDDMSDVVERFSREHGGVTLLRRPHRGGKSSALNCALPFIRAEIVVCVDADSHLAENAIWEIVQPFADPQVGAVSASVLARNPFVRLVTWMQSFEYLQNILVGRKVAARLDVLGIISGAFGAVRRDAIQRLKGWDVGPGEDGDLTIRLRRSGYRIAFAPQAQCYTNVPESWTRLVKQRRRWQWAVVTFDCRKHVDMANPLSPGFRLADLLVLAEHWIFDIALTYVSFAYVLWLLVHPHSDLWKMFVWCYMLYAIMQVVQAGVFLYYSNNRARELKIAMVAPLMPLYHALMRTVTLWAVTEEFLSRRSARDNFVPAYVREATWHW